MLPPHPHLISYPPSQCPGGNRRESKFGRRATREALGLRWALVHPNRNGGGLQRCGSLNAVPPRIRTDRGEKSEKVSGGLQSSQAQLKSLLQPCLGVLSTRAREASGVLTAHPPSAPSDLEGALPSWAEPASPHLHYSHVGVYINIFISKGKSLQ